MGIRKNQIIFIHGGTTFQNNEQFYERLKKYIYNPNYKPGETLGSWIKEELTEFDVHSPLMPNKQFADYTAWGIWFEKVLKIIDKNKEVKFILIGQSTGGIFLTKYLSENKVPKQINQLHLISPVFNSKSHNLNGTNSFTLNPNKLKNIQNKTNKIFIYHSKDDKEVPIKDSEEYLKYLTKVKFFKFENRGHFRNPKFPELITVIKENLKE